MKKSPQLDRYKQLVGEEQLASIYRAASPLTGVHVLHLNTTAFGGGIEVQDSFIASSLL